MVACSVTRWINYLFQFWPFLSMKVCPIASKNCQIIAKVFKLLPKCQNVDTSGLTGDMHQSVMAKNFLVQANDYVKAIGKFSNTSFTLDHSYLASINPS